MLKLISKVVMWGSNKSVYVFLLFLFFREKHDVDEPWTNRGQTVERPIELSWNGLELSLNNLELSWTPIGSMYAIYGNIYHPQKNHPNSASKVFYIYQYIFGDGL